MKKRITACPYCGDGDELRAVSKEIDLLLSIYWVAKKALQQKIPHTNEEYALDERIKRYERWTARREDINKSEKTF